MYRNNNDSKKVLVAVVSLCAVVAILSVFTVLVYKGKRLVADEFKKDNANLHGVSQSDSVSLSDIGVTSQKDADSVSSSHDTVSSNTEEVSSKPEEVSSAEPVSSETKTEASPKNDILNPNFKSDYYIVVYTENQEIIVYKKNEKGKYIDRFHSLQCSTGAAETPTREGVYTIGEKSKWVQLSDNEFAQYACLISKDDNYFISSIPFSKKDPSTMIDGGYENIGTAVSKGGIQLSSRDAYWIYMNMPKGTQVNVVNKTGPEVKFKSLPKRVAKNGGWEPSDRKAEGNPYFK